jgi:hypothetical protein
MDDFDPLSGCAGCLVGALVFLAAVVAALFSP